MEPTVQRQVDLDAPVEEVWEAIVDAEVRAGWLGRGPLDVRPGGRGSLVEPDGTRREVRVHHVEPQRHLGFEWTTDAGDRSHVDLVLEPVGPGTRFTVTETRCAAAPAVDLVGLELSLLCRRAMSPVA